MNKMDISTLTLEQMVELRDKLDWGIRTYADGFQYELHIRSYGRNWRETMTNSQAVQERCYEYDGDEGIVDVYTTNPDLQIHNYGSTYYFPTLEDAKQWRDKRYLENRLPEWEAELDEWDNRENTPFRDRPRFAPIHTREDIAEHKEQLKQMSGIVEPIHLNKSYKEYETDTNE